MVRRLAEEPLLTRGIGAKSLPPGHIGGVEPVVGPPPRDERRFDWGLVVISVIFLAGAGAIVGAGQWLRQGNDLEAGETRIIAGRPDTVIPDSPGGATPASGSASPAAAPATAAPRPTAAGGTKPVAGGADTLPPPATSGYSLSSPAQGGDVSTRPSAHSAPEPQGQARPRPTSSAPGVLQAPPGVKPVQ